MATKLDRLFEPVDAASAKAFRVLFGLLMFVAVVRFFVHGWIDDYYVMPEHHFTYYGFEWVQPWSATGMYIHFAVMGVLALVIAAGVYTRASSALFGVLFAYAHFIDKTNYLNHYYLIICVALLMAFLPLERGHATVPRWVVWALRAQIGLVYVFGGIAKLKYSWLVEAQPLKIWLAANTDFPVIGSAFEHAWVAHAFAIAGAAFDLAIVPLLLWRRTRIVAFGVLVTFHVVTAQLFQLGMFPWVMIASSLVFFSPSWPRRKPVVLPETTYRPRRLVPVLLGVYFTFHVAMPLRHWLYPGDVCWTEEGFRFAWNVMLIEKDGSVELHVREPSTGRRWEVAPTQYLTRYQAKMMSTQPDMILQLAHIVAADFRARGVLDPEVRVDAFAALNGHPRARLIDRDVDLAHETDGLAPRSWILREPVPVRRTVARQP